MNSLLEYVSSLRDEGDGRRENSLSCANPISNIYFPIKLNVKRPLFKNNIPKKLCFKKKSILKPAAFNWKLYKTVSVQ